MEHFPNMQTECDVVVIGGGPAGSTAGHVLARHGRKAIVVERDTFPRFHIGESLLPANMEILERLGVRQEIEDAGSVPKYGARILRADGTPQVRIRFADGAVPCAPHALQVVRATFDDILLRACRGAGAEVLEGHEAIRAEREGDSWRVVVKNDAREAREIRARHLIDASGRDTFLARKRRSKQMADGHRRIAIFAHYAGVRRDPGEEGGDILVLLRKDGWLWVIPLADGATSIGLVVQGDAMRASERSAEEVFEHAVAHTPAIASAVETAERCSPIRTASNYSYECGDPARDGALSVGDARAFLDPVFSTGVFLAMQGGESAAEALNATFVRPDRTSTILRDWSRKQQAISDYYWDLINRFYTPEFVDLLLQPSDAPILKGLVPAINSVLAGVGPNGSLHMKAMLKLFEGIQYAHRRFEITEKLDLGSVFDG